MSISARAYLQQYIRDKQPDGGNILTADRLVSMVNESATLTTGQQAEVEGMISSISNIHEKRFIPHSLSLAIVATYINSCR